jgi:hypothetical protein
MAYLNLILAYKEKADKIKANADRNLRKVLEKVEIEYGEILKPASTAEDEVKQVCGHIYGYIYIYIHIYVCICILEYVYIYTQIYVFTHIIY